MVILSFAGGEGRGNGKGNVSSFELLLNYVRMANCSDSSGLVWPDWCSVQYDENKGKDDEDCKVQDRDQEQDHDNDYVHYEVENENVEMD